MNTNPLAILSGVDLVMPVHGIEGAKSYQIGPNCRVPLFDDSEDIMYIKQVDANGYPLSLKAYRFEEIALVSKEETPTGISLNDIRQIIKEEIGSIKEELVNGQQSVSTVNPGSDEYKPTASGKAKQPFKPKHESTGTSNSNQRREQSAANSGPVVNG